MIPTEPVDRKLSKIEVLRLATSYIQHLVNQLNSGNCWNNGNILLCIINSVMEFFFSASKLVRVFTKKQNTQSKLLHFVNRHNASLTKVVRHKNFE